MNVIFTILKVIVLIFLGMAFIGFYINGITGWGDKGKNRKLILVTLTFCILSFGLLYLLSIVIN